MYTLAKNHQQGVTLIEIVLALVLIALGASAISALLVGGLNINQTNEKHIQDLRAAESCYETILAIHEGDFWNSAGGSPTPLSSSECPTNPGNPVTVDGSGNPKWVSNKKAQNRFNEACKIPELDDSSGNIRCKQVKISGNKATKFEIPVRGSRSLEVILPY